ncbi:hypothetical protein M3Y96_00478900 [Aphelenchoides besseyi]|nr:hypothetical protein M3Y96_00478900 [Aphelenchoides besseyi]
MSSSRSTCCLRHAKCRNTGEDQHLVSCAVSPALKCEKTSPLTPSKLSTDRSKQNDLTELETPKQKPKSKLQLRSADQALFVNPQKLKQRDLVVNSNGQYFLLRWLTIDNPAGVPLIDRQKLIAIIEHNANVFKNSCRCEDHSST